MDAARLVNADKEPGNWMIIGRTYGDQRFSPLDKINASPYGLGDLICRFTHNGYHLGQISKIREFYEVKRS